MKRLSKGRQKWLARQQRIKNRKLSRIVDFKRQPKWASADTIVAPSYFCLASVKNEHGKASKAYFSFLEKIRKFSGDKLRIDLTSVGRMVVDAVVVFKAELCYLKDRGVSLRAMQPKKVRTQQVLTQTGISDLLGLPRVVQVDREDLIYWRVASGAWDLEQPSRLESLLDHGQDSSSLYTGMVESVANCIEHAYKDHPQRRKFLPGQDGWWGFQQLRDGYLSTCICDLGIGIPTSLPISLASEQGLLGKLFALVSAAKGRDVQSILAAIEYGRSSTNAPERGKGLQDAHNVIDAAGEGEFHLASNGGFYFYQRKHGDPVPKSGTRRLQGSVAGTIYFWRYPLQSSAVPASATAQGALT